MSTNTTIHINPTTGEVTVETDNPYETFKVAVHNDDSVSYSNPDDVIINDEDFTHNQLEASHGKWK